jgi:hypothetical protein
MLRRERTRAGRNKITENKIDQMRSFIYKINLALFEHLEIIGKTLNEMYQMSQCFVIAPTNARK